MADVLTYSRAGRSGFIPDIVLSLRRHRRALLAATLLGGLFGAAIMGIQGYLGAGAGVNGGEPMRFEFSQGWDAMNAGIGLVGGAAIGAGIAVVAALVAGLTGREVAARAAVVGVGLVGGAGLGALLGGTVAVDRAVVVTVGTGDVARDHDEYVANYHSRTDMAFTATGGPIKLSASVTRRSRPLVSILAGLGGAVIGAFAGRGLLQSGGWSAVQVQPLASAVPVEKLA